MIHDKIPLRADALKAERSFCGLVQLDGHKIYRNGKSCKTRCPFHDDQDPSLQFYKNDTRAKCFPCGWDGDMFDYESATKNLDFLEALASLEQRAPMRDKADLAAELEPEAEPQSPVEMTQEQKDHGAKFAQYLKETPVAADTLCHRRGNCWKAETITQLASEGVLGWDMDQVIFIYPTGIKTRVWPGRKIFWKYGNPSGGPWRSYKMQAAKEVILCEGETDAISLIDCGFEQDSEVAVVACPSASGFQRQWGPLFQGKEVVIAFDNDEAGIAGMAKAVECLKPYAASIYKLDWSVLEKGGNQ